ncbi:DUF4233 domain-containing protein [Cellulomonas sp. ATA003]|uniref:DUF4233 domain-containing protein n=1 Tax=Cellulomonas sp. ATA003 TaxID=3073064 RepID=UPI002872B155|nr:DUF4233 domain-containing protein [Cellulomonas sp. ATA003]WNB84937.1 DUF4233 domain-containing protein [Cellulomonas sp. ATA003]
MTTSPAPDAPAPGGRGRGPAAAPARRRRSARRQFAATTLAMEAFVVLFGTLVAYGLRVAPPGVLWAVGGGLAFVLLLLSGMLRAPGGYLAGTLVQIPVLASGFVLLFAPVPGGGFGATILFVISAVFVALWVFSLRVGGRIDRERAEWDAAHADA